MQDSCSVGHTFLLESGLLGAFESFFAEASGLLRRFFLSVVWLPLMALAQKGYPVNIFVGNLAFTMTEQDVRDLFARYGVVDRVNLITDRETGRLRGFGFVEMPDTKAAQEAIAALNGRDMAGRALNVNEARPREERPSGGPRRDGGADGGGRGAGVPPGAYDRLAQTIGDVEWRPERTPTPENRNKSPRYVRVGSRNSLSGTPIRAGIGGMCATPTPVCPGA